MNPKRVVQEYCETLHETIAQHFPGQRWDIEKVSQNKHFKLRAVERSTNAVVILTVPVTPSDGKRGKLNWVSTARKSLQVAIERSRKA